MANRDIDLSGLASTCGMAGELAKAAADLAVALESGIFTEALDYNLRLWQAIRTVVNQDTGLGPVREELTRAAARVTATTLAMGRAFSTDAVIALARLDLEVAQNLFAAVIGSVLHDGGPPDFNDTGFWPAVERGLRDLVSR